MLKYEAPIIIEPNQKADAAVIWLHGLGAHGSDFVDAINPMKLDADVRFILPHAPAAPVTINGGWVMPSWYDILSASPTRKIDEQSLSQSVAYVHQLIDELVAEGFDAQRVFVFGFSQGGALAYQSVFTYPQPLGGLVALSTYVPTLEQFHTVLTNSVQPLSLPMWISHGSEDDVVPTALGRQAFEYMNRHEFKPVWSDYPMAHSVCLEQLQDLGAWLNTLMD